MAAPVFPPPNNNLRRFRLQVGLSAAACGRKAGVDGQTITRIETGFIRKPRPLTKKAIAEVFGVRVKDVFPE